MTHWTLGGVPGTQRASSQIGFVFSNRLLRPIVFPAGGLRLHKCARRNGPQQTARQFAALSQFYSALRSRVRRANNSGRALYHEILSVGARKSAGSLLIGLGSLGIGLSSLGIGSGLVWVRLFPRVRLDRGVKLQSADCGLRTADCNGKCALSPPQAREAPSFP